MSCSRRAHLLTLLLMMMSTDVRAQTPSVFDSTSFSFSSPFDSAQTFMSGFGTDSDFRGNNPFGNTNLAEYTRSENNLPFVVPSSRPPNFGFKTSFGSTQIVPSRRPPSKKQAKAYNNISNPFFEIQKNVKTPLEQTISYLPPRDSLNFKAPKPDRIAYDPKKGVELSYKPKINQEIHFREPDSVDIIQKITQKATRRPPSNANKKRSSRPHQGSYQPPVYKQKPSKAADPYKAEESQERYKQPDISFSLDPFKTEYEFPHISHKPTKAYKKPEQSYTESLVSFVPKSKSFRKSFKKRQPVYDSFEPIFDFHKPSKIFHDTFQLERLPNYYESSLPIIVQESYEPIKPSNIPYKARPYKKEYVKPIPLQPVYAPPEKYSKQIQKSYKPLYDPYKPLDDDYFHNEKPYKQSNIPGRAGIDYPTYNEVPYTSFSCKSVPYRPGMYANVEAGCQAYHVCDDGRHGKQGASFLCTNGTLFNQVTFNCDWWYNVDCKQATKFYDLNVDPDHNPYYKAPYKGPLNYNVPTISHGPHSSSGYDYTHHSPSYDKPKPHKTTFYNHKRADSHEKHHSAFDSLEPYFFSKRRDSTRPRSKRPTAFHDSSQFERF